MAKTGVKATAMKAAAKGVALTAVPGETLKIEVEVQNVGLDPITKGAVTVAGSTIVDGDGYTNKGDSAEMALEPEQTVTVNAERIVQNGDIGELEIEARFNSAVAASRGVTDPITVTPLGSAEKGQLAEPFEGKELTDLVGENYEVTAEGTNITATGDVYIVDGWDAYPKAEQDKAYPVVRFTAPEGTVLERETLSGVKRRLDIPADGFDDFIIAIDPENPMTDITLYPNAEAETGTDYHLDFSGCNFTVKE